MTLVALAATAVVGVSLAPAAQAAGPAQAPALTAAQQARLRQPSVAVSLGDSYISGVAGRWRGNSDSPLLSRFGTDRAWHPKSGHWLGVVEPSVVYGNTVGGCTRSDSAPILSAHLSFAAPINLACSGAQTVNVQRAIAGGRSLHGEPPQDDQLAALAADHRVRMVVLSIGGNDVGFGNIVSSCVDSYVTHSTACSVKWKTKLAASLQTMATSVARTIDDIHGTMTDAGYLPGDYRLVLQSYPSPLPPAGEDHYSGKYPDTRLLLGRCPLLDADEAWAAGTLTPAVSRTLAGVANSRGAQFLDLSDAFRGHELCADAAKHPRGGTPNSAGVEWVRFIDLTHQGDYAESLHPNYFGQQALGRCLALAAASAGNVACHGVAKQDVSAVHVTPLPEL
jgi:lysophospholipase L1-like esterase